MKKNKWWINLLGWLLDTLLIVLITLKVSGVITWSWWLVLLPLIVPLGFLLLSVIALVIFWVIILNKEKFGKI